LFCIVKIKSRGKIKIIVIFIDNIEDFITILERKKIGNEIYYEAKEIKSESSDLSSEIVFDITLHFLSKFEEFLVLYETKVNIAQPNSSNIDSNFIITEIQKILNHVDDSLLLIKGKIREIFLSYSF